MFRSLGRIRAPDLCLAAVLLAATACASKGPATSPLNQPGPAIDTVMDFAAKRPRPRQRAVDSTALELAVTKRLFHGPLALALARRTRNPEVAERAASAVVREAERLRLSPSLLAAVLLIENAPLDTTAVSSQGALGLMQVMPVHAGSYGCSSNDLMTVEASICHGARLLKTYVRRNGSIPLALRRYNGCVRGRNTPRCYRYPMRVLRTASRLRREVLVTAAGFQVGGPEELAMRAKGRAAQIPPASIDSTAPLATSSNACSSLFACLRDRWSRTR